MIKKTLMVALVAAGLGSTAAAGSIDPIASTNVVQPGAQTVTVPPLMKPQGEPLSTTFPNFPMSNLAPVIGAGVAAAIGIAVISGNNSTSTTGTVD